MNKLTNVESKDDFARLLGFSNSRFMNYVLYVLRTEELYETFTIPKKSGGERIINAPKKELKILQKKLAKLLWDCYIEDLESKSKGKNIKIPNLSHAFEKNKSIITNSQLHRNKKYVLNIDLKDLEGKAKNGDKLACYILGRSYDSEENGAEQSYEKAMYWYEKGKELGDPCCTYGVGACYYFGDGVEQDKEKAKQIHINAYKPLLELIEKEKENPRKQSFSKFCLGAYYYFGFGDIERDEKKAFELIHACAMQGHLPAIYDLGANFYYNGVGTEKNLRLSEYYLKMAVDAGLQRAKVKFEQYKDTYESEIEK